jgi:uncharacterized protein YwlG (UPF0340 family)
MRRLAARRSISEKDSDPTHQSHPASRPGGRRQKSTFAQPLNLIEIGAVKAPAGCDIAQSSQIAHAQISLQPGIHHGRVPHAALCLLVDVGR